MVVILQQINHTFLTRKQSTGLRKCKMRTNRNQIIQTNLEKIQKYFRRTKNINNVNKMSSIRKPKKYRRDRQKDKNRQHFPKRFIIKDRKMEKEN
jgi:hypothetical protein